MPLIARHAAARPLPACPALRARPGHRPHRLARRPTAASSSAADEGSIPSSPSVASLKAALLRAAGGTDRGKAADRNARVAILRAVEALEEAAPAKDAALDAAGLSGEWGLVYSGPGGEVEAAAEDTATYEKRTGGLEGPVIAALRPIGRFFVTSTGTTQRIDAGKGTVSNIAAFRLVGGLDGELDVEGTATPAPPGAVTPTIGARCGRARTAVAFTRLAVRLGGRGVVSLPLTAFNPNGWIETTFLDGEVRVSRGDKGSVFVAAKRKT